MDDVLSAFPAGLRKQLFKSTHISLKNKKLLFKVAISGKAKLL